MTRSELNNLTVLHYLKDPTGRGLDEDKVRSLSTHGLCIDTCLRQLWVIPAVFSPEEKSGADIYHGDSAYSFLLQTMTGLNSSVPGETNVQGQFQCSWKRWQQAAPAAQRWTVNQLMRNLLIDARKIRSAYLQNIGGQSYGSLARKLLQPSKDARILFVGSGKFSLSMLPFFKDQQTAVWNHRLHKGLRLDDSVRIFRPAEQAIAAAWASVIVLTTPAIARHDRSWFKLVVDQRVAQVLHLGRRRAKAGIWQQLPGKVAWQTLDDIFELRSRQTSVRDLNIMRARLACEQLARAAAPETHIPAVIPQRA